MPLILQIAIAPFRHCFDYLAPNDCEIAHLLPGVRVRVPFRHQEKVGILLAHSQTSTHPLSQLKHAIAILDEAPLMTKPLFELAQWASQYYHHPLSDVLLSTLPKAYRDGKNAQALAPATEPPLIPSPALALNDAQTRAVESITAAVGRFKVFLLDGVTGSGKTEVYLQAVEKHLHTGHQALILVPEISLTPQLVSRFQTRFPCQIAVLHSSLTDKQRLNAWLMAKDGRASIVIGTRSAIFVPLAKPGILILDEEHDTSFKQQEGFRYSARDLAVVRARIENIPLVMGSATPSFESVCNAQQARYEHLLLPERAGRALHPSFHIIDIRNQSLDEGLSTPLLHAIREHLDQNGQVLLFLNRRGFSPSLICHSCGWAANCRRCDARLTLHLASRQLHCHHCNASLKIPVKCAQCTSTQLLPLGVGTERLEQVLARHFPAEPIARIDRDTTRRKGSLEKMLDSVHQGHSRILLGTQMLAKGHHFPDVTLVAIVNGDNGLYSTDFRAAERIAQLIIQVAGRAGRAERPGKVFIQTHQPDHPLLTCLTRESYTHFVDMSLKERHAAQLPPYTHMMLLRAEAHDQTLPLDFLHTTKKRMMALLNNTVNLLGPIPAPMEKRAGRYRAQLLFQSLHRAPLQRLIPLLLNEIDAMKTTRRLRWSIDVDPIDLL